MNEDRLLVGKSLFGVFDGATSLKENSMTKEGMTGGALAAQIAKDTFSGAVGNLFDTAVAANRRIGLSQVAAGVTDILLFTDGLFWLFFYLKKIQVK